LCFKIYLGWELVWFKEIANYEKDMIAFKAISCSANSILVATKALNLNNSLVKMDTACNVIWYKKLWNNVEVINTAMQNDGYGNFYYSSSRDIAIEADDNKENGIVVKLDSNGTILWTKYFNQIPNKSA
jgi:hypothetical protein